MSLSDLMLADKWNNSYKHQGPGALSVPTLTFLSFYIKMYHCTTELTHSMHKKNLNLSAVVFNDISFFIRR